MQYNPFDQPPPLLSLKDPFIMSSGVAPPMNVQMAMYHHQQQQMTMNRQQQSYQTQYSQMYQQPYQQQNMLVPYNNRYAMGTSNPFGDVYEHPQSSTPSNGNHGLI